MVTEKENRIRKNSRFLSKVLRHNPELIGIHLDQAGWVAIEDLLAGCAKKGKKITESGLFETVEFNNKQRFEFSEDKRFIRACQGHSVSVDLGLLPSSPPATLFHGTTHRVWEKIKSEGLKSMSRQDVHLSASLETAVQVGNRHVEVDSALVILVIHTKEMEAKGHLFRISTNGVWLTDYVPPEFISMMGDYNDIED